MRASNTLRSRAATRDRMTSTEPTGPPLAQDALGSRSDRTAGDRHALTCDPRNFWAVAHVYDTGPMIAKTLPLLLLCACAASPTADGPAQPGLAALARPYTKDLQAVGITRLVSSDTDAMVRLETLSGPVYVRYPQDLPRTAFVLEVEPEGLRASATSFEGPRDQRVLAALLPEAIAATMRNNQLEWYRSNPWH